MPIKTRSPDMAGLHLKLTVKERSPGGQTGLFRALPQHATLVPNLLLMTVGVLLAGFTFTSMAVVALTQWTNVPDNLFFPYADILPGQPASAVEARGFSCVGSDHNYYRSEDYQNCVLAAADGVFYQIQVGVSKGIIQQTDFCARNHALRHGDLALLLGAPYDHHFRSIAGFSWRGKFVLVATNGDQPWLFRPVWKVTFTNIG
jgi:hypothetical protein